MPATVGERRTFPFNRKRRLPENGLREGPPSVATGLGDEGKEKKKESIEKKDKRKNYGRKSKFMTCAVVHVVVWSLICWTKT